MFLILFATQTGNSEELAGEIYRVLLDGDHEAELVDMADAYPELLADADTLIAVVCTWSDGTFPDNAVAFWTSLKQLRPDCSHLRYGVVALGDRLYAPHYQEAAHDLAAQLDELGARRIAEDFEIDGPVSSSHRQEVRAWVARLLEVAVPR